MLAPEPFFQPRGTPISVYFRIKALSELGHSTDLITYPLGSEINFKNLKTIRVPNLCGFRKIKIGPSFQKLPLDFLLFLCAWWMILKNRYDMVFSHEEAAFFGVLLAKAKNIPHLYDMHSSLPQQLENFNFTRSLLFKQIFIWMEKFIAKNSQAIIVICLDLFKKMERMGYAEKSVLIENFLEFESPPLSEEKIAWKRKEYSPSGEKIVLYAGNFKPYQGIPLLLQAMSKIKKEDVILLLVGGNDEEKKEMHKLAESLKILNRVRFIGQIPASQVALYVSIADVLVSPRLKGTNTPLKIYSFLKSGKPVVATKLWTHTQILDESIAVLVPPDPESLAEGLEYALRNGEAKKRALLAKERCDKEYTYPKYLERLNEALQKASLQPKKKGKKSHRK